MRKRLLFSLLLITVLVLASGCKRGVIEGKTEYTCERKNINDSAVVSTIKMTWKKDITYKISMDDEGKLTYYSFLTHYMYNSTDDCNYWCDLDKKWNDEVNEKNYQGGHRETTCYCDKKELDEEYIYDDIPNLDNVLRYDIKELRSDNTFDISAWVDKYENERFDCY